MLRTVTKLARHASAVAPSSAAMHVSQVRPQRHLKSDEEEKPEILVGLAELFSKRGIGVDFVARLHKTPDFSIEGFKRRRKARIDEERVYDQRYIAKRHGALGPDLAAAVFIVHRGASVKFVGKEEWYKKNEDDETGLPTRYEEGWHLEAIDASETELVYEGMENLSNLEHLKALRLCGCPYVDDWCIDRLSLFQDSLEQLDLSGCTRVTERGLSALYRLKKLKSLTLGYLTHIRDLNLVALMLEEALPQCEIRGVDYWKPELVADEAPRNDSEEEQTSPTSRRGHADD